MWHWLRLIALPLSVFVLYAAQFLLMPVDRMAASDGVEGDWFLTSATGPAPRVGFALAYDSVRQRVVLFGGHTFVSGNNVFLNDTWEYDGTSWTRINTAASPGARRGFQMVYDAARQRMVIWGGYFGDSVYGNDTWEYDGVNWVLVDTPNRPTRRTGYAMAFDANRSKVIMYGGTSAAGGTTRVWADMWEYDGVNWTQVAIGNPSPAPRYAHAMIYDDQRKRIVLFGGYNASQFFNDTWEYDGSAWAQISTPHAPPERSDSALAFDRARQRVLLFGGSRTGGQLLNDTWEYDGGDWVELNPAQRPSTRADHALAYDSGRDRTVLFSGGYFDTNTHAWVLFDDTWEYGILPSATATATSTPTSTPTSTTTSPPAATFTPTITPLPPTPTSTPTVTPFSTPDGGWRYHIYLPLIDQQTELQLLP
ncbi:MAG: kelch repeat-containing protein [Anaerolineae bacterium]